MKTLILSIIMITNFCLFGQVRKPIEPKHEGFYARSTIGLGSTNLTESANTSSGGRIDVEVSGLSYDINLQIGYSVIENLQLYGAFGANILSSPTYKLNGQEEKVGSTSVNMIRYGIGASYYLMPHNMYITFDVTSARDEIEIRNVTGKSQRGAIFNFGLGKEWWVHRNWGLGVGVYYFTGSIDDEPFEGQTPKIRNTGFGLSFSVTFN